MVMLADLELGRVRQRVGHLHRELQIPPATGVPEITPAELSPRPGGKLPPITLQL